MGRVLAAVLIGASAVLWPAVAQPAARTLAPALHVRRYNPFAVRGRHFRPLERVKLTLDGTWTKRVRADPSGSFVATFRGVSVDVCDGFVLKAVGSDGSLAHIRALPRECASRNPG